MYPNLSTFTKKKYRNGLDIIIYIMLYLGSNYYCLRPLPKNFMDNDPNKIYLGSKCVHPIIPNFFCKT